MRSSALIRGAVVTLSCVGMLLPQSVVAAAPTHGRPASAHRSDAILDVELGPGGTLHGNVMDAQGVARPGAPVALGRANRLLARTQTDADGRFLATGLRPGVCLVTTPGGGKVCRLWASGTAPPSRTRQVSLVCSPQVVRGQSSMQGAIGDWVSEHPFLTYGLIATAIVVPIVVIAANDDDAPGS